MKRFTENVVILGWGDKDKALHSYPEIASELNRYTNEGLMSTTFSQTLWDIQTGFRSMLYQEIWVKLLDTEFWWKYRDEK